MIRAVYFILLVLLISSCADNNMLKKVDLIIYTGFSNPKDTYNSLLERFMQSGLVDSIKIIGMPIEELFMDVQTDTTAVRRYEVSLDTLNNQIELTQNIELKTVDEDSLNDLTVIESGQEVQIDAIAQFNLKPAYYKPGIFVPKPEVFYYKNRKAVKMELYCIKKHEKEVIKLIENKIRDYSATFMNNRWEYEIVNQ